MDIWKMIAELREESARIEKAITNLEKLSTTRTPRRGLQPAWSRVTSPTAPQSGKGLNGSTGRPVE